MTKLVQKSRLTLRRARTKGGWTYVVMPGLGRVLRDTGLGQDPRARSTGHAVPQLVHGARETERTSCRSRPTCGRRSARRTGDVGDRPARGAAQLALITGLCTGKRLTDRAAHLLLNPSSTLDRERVHAAGVGQLDREQVAQHHRVEHTLGAGLALGLEADHGGGVGLDRLGGELEAPALARDAGRGPRGRSRRSGPSAPDQPSSSLWSASGRIAEKAGSFAFSLIWHFQR